MVEREGTGNWRSWAKGCGCLSIVFIALPILLLGTCRWSDGHPTDSAMIREFQRNQAAFADLHRMVTQEQRVTRVARDFIWIDGMQNVTEAERPSYLSDDRLARYRALFDKLNLESGVIRYEDGSVGFLRSSSGFVTGGSSKEFVRSRSMSVPVLAPSDQRTLEEACVPITGCGSVRRIAPEWFISFERH